MLAERVLPELARWAAEAIAAGVRTRLMLQTYERELERYGGPEATATWEMLSCVDSSCRPGPARGDATRSSVRASSTGSSWGWSAWPTCWRR